MSLQSPPPKVLKVPIMLAVDDRTRHWLYFRAFPRTNWERQKSIHKQDVGGATVSVTQPIHNGRNVPDLTLDRTSFELVQDCPTGGLSTEDFYQLAENDNLRQTYYSAVETYVANKLGCDKVMCVHSQVRNAARQETDKNVQGYAGGAPHTDSSSISGDLFALDILGGVDDDAKTEYQRYCYLNLWRNISEDPIEDNHLAVLDERSTVKPDDYIVKDLFGDGYDVVQYGLNARHAAQHQWYYFPSMTQQEGILFKQMDSDWTKSGRICFHMSVSDPTVDAQEKVKPRESIEVRMLCLWKHAKVDSMPTHENIHRDLIQDPTQVTQELSTLETATFWQLVVALLGKIPLVKHVVGYILGTPIGGAAAPFKPYSGKPSDYELQFTTAVDWFPSWPAFAKQWVKSTMKQQKDAEQGIEVITKAIVDDSMGYQKTKSFSPEAKAEIVKYLLNSDKYMGVAKKHLAPLAS